MIIHYSGYFSHGPFLEGYGQEMEIVKKCGYQSDIYPYLKKFYCGMIHFITPNGSFFKFYSSTF